MCTVPENGKPSACGCHTSNQEAEDTVSDSGKLNQETNGISKIRSGVLFVVACLASPCCTPLYVPLAVVLLAGTPTAVWLSAHIGWVYGVLTLVSIISLVLAFRWWPQSSVKRGIHTSHKSETKMMTRSN